MKISIKVMPHSMREEVVKQGDDYVVRVKAMPQEGKANEAVIELVAKHFKVPKSVVKIVSGLTSRNKIIDIRAR
jgi:uncharacterized protein (TIGR00251 family)